MEGRQQFTVRAFCANRVGEEQVSFHGGEGNDLECSFPGVLQKIESTADIFPVPEMKKRVLEMKILIRIP